VPFLVQSTEQVDKGVKSLSSLRSIFSFYCTCHCVYTDAINVLSLANNYVKWLFGYAECDIVGVLFV